MTTRRLIALGILFPGLMSGCGSGGRVRSWEWTPEKTETAAPAQPAQPAQDQQKAPARPGDRMDADGGTPDVLAQKTQSYAQEVAAMMQSRRPSTQTTASPSQVKWTDVTFPNGSDIRLGSESAARPAAAIQPPPVGQIDASAAAANQDAQASKVPPQIPLAQPPVSPQPESSLRLSPVAVADATPKPAISSNFSQDPLSLRAESRLKDSPRDVWVHTEYQLLRLLRDEPAPEMSTLTNLPPEDRELVTAVVDGLTNFRNAMRQDSNMLLSAKIRPLVEMTERLKTQAELTIPAIALCTKVDRFGVYEPIDPPRFPADRDHPVIVYCEVANFMSSLNAAQLWQTQLQWEMTLYTEQAIPVWSEKSQPVEEGSRTRRHDFFVRKLITLPRTLPIGRYLLKVTIIDKQSNHVAEATAPLVIAAQ